MRPNLKTSVAIGIVSVWMTSCAPAGPSSSGTYTHASPSAPTSYPSTFVGAPDDSSAIAEFDSNTGQLRRTLASDGTLASLAASAGQVFYVRKGTSGPCRSEIWTVDLASDKPRRSLVVNGLISAMAVTPDGDLLAYVSSDCSVPGTPVLVLRNLLTGSQRTLNGVAAEASALAWAAGGARLALSVPQPPYGALKLLILQDPFARAQTASVPCPGAATNCSQEAPAFDPQGELFYVAAIDPDPQHPCTVVHCHYQTYVVTAVSGATASSIYSHSGRANSVPFLSAATGTALLFFVTEEAGPSHDFRITGRDSKQLPAAVWSPQW